MPFLMICAIVLIIGDLVIWFRVLRLPADQRHGQLVAAVAVLGAALIFSWIAFTNQS